MATTYSTDADVKERLSITSSNHDTQIGNKRDQAYALINTELDPYDAVPLTAPTQAISDIEADWAAGLFYEERFTPTAGAPAHSHLIDRAKAALKEYIIVNYQVRKKVQPTNFFKSKNSTNTWDATS